MLTLSIIIPTFNESDVVQAQLKQLRAILPATVEVIVVDGGSTDNTRELALPFVDHLILSDQKGRANQMNLGAKIAHGRLLLFLHIDTLISKTTLEPLLFASENIWGFFKIKFSKNTFVFKLIAFCINKRSSLTSVATGDQCMFVSKSLFKSIGGFASIPLMEDVEISKRLRQNYSPLVVSNKVITSSRRWEKYGVVKTILLMWRLRLQYFFGAPAEELAKQYH